MKRIISVAGVLLAAVLSSPTAILEQENEPSEQKDRAEATVAVPVSRPNEAAHGSVVLSGVFVQMVASDKPFELINPLAPADAGRAEDNTAYDLITKNSEGLKLFAISF